MLMILYLQNVQVAFNSMTQKGRHRNVFVSFNVLFWSEEVTQSQDL